MNDEELEKLVNDHEQNVAINKNRREIEELKKCNKTLLKKLNKQSTDLAYIKGTLDEMKRHNGRVIKVLAAIITALLTALVTVVGYVVT